MRSPVILKAPHPLISKAVEDAVKRWKIRPYEVANSVRARVQGELRFVYSIEGNVARVETLPREQQEKASREYKQIDLEFRRDWKTNQK